MEWILYWIVGAVFGGISAFSLLPTFVRGSAQWPQIPWVLLAGFGGVGACILSGGLVWTARHLRLTTASGRIAEGRVVDQRKEYVTLNFKNNASQRDPLRFDNRTRASWIRYHPVVEFQTEGGEQVRFEGRIYGSEKPMIPTGSSVRIYYDPSRPSNAFIGSFMEAWLGPLVVSLVGALCLTYGLLGFVGGRRALEADIQAQLSPEAIERHIQEDAMTPYQFRSHIQGSIDRIERTNVTGPPQWEFVIKAVRPGEAAPDEFRSPSVPVYPGEGFIGRKVDVYLDPKERYRYTVPFGSLLQEIAAHARNAPK